MQIATLNKPIKEAVPHIFKRPVLSVRPSDSLLHVGTFLALGPQIYVDGLVVINDNNEAVGTIGGRHFAEYILYHHKSEWWSVASASDIMTRFDSTVEADQPLTAALDIFARTEFAFVPVTTSHRVVTSLSVRDLLKIVAASSLDKPIRELSSSLIEIDGNTSIGNALEIMLEQGIRTLLVREYKENTNTNTAPALLNDRKILEFLISPEGREKMISKGLGGLFEVEVRTLDLEEAKIVDSDISASTAAGLFNISVPCLLLDRQNLILTPWDVVMKGLKRIEKDSSNNR